MRKMGITRLQLSNGDWVEVIMPFKKGDQLSCTCFRGRHCHQAGNFSVWNNFRSFWHDPEAQALLAAELEKLVAKEEAGEEHRIELEFSTYIGWDRMMDMEDLSLDELEACELRNINSQARALHLPDHVLPAPTTNIVTMVFNMKHDGHWIFYICDMYPGPDCGEVRGDMTERKKLIYFHWSARGEELEASNGVSN